MATKKSSFGPPRTASFLLGLPPNRPHPLKKALRNYHERLRRHHIQFIEWQEHLSRKPDPQAMPPGAAEALKEAEETIGNRILKTETDYVAQPGHNTQLRLCLTRKEIYDTKRAFNEKVLELREHKLRLVERMKHIGERLAEIRMEIPPKLVKSPPIIPQIDEDLEFPENNLEIKPEPILLKPMPKKSVTERKKSVLYPLPRIRQPRVARFVPLIESRPLAATWEFLKTRSDQENTPVEKEMRERRIERHLYEQDMLLVDAEVAIQQFDSRLRQLQRERIRVQEKNQLLELHLYQLHREMNVLNRFEAHEDRLAAKVYSKLMQVKGVQDQIIDCEHRIEEHKTEKEQLEAECQEQHRLFKRLVQDNKFADFLRRIFKKKYRPPRERDEDESSESESSSSSSEEEDEGSLDSRDIGPIRLDPNICPEGCDREVYDKTYELRNRRHKYEQEIIEQDHFVELLKKDIDAHNKVKRKLTVQLDARKNELREFMLEKQSCMNEVDQVVVLRYDQIRASALRNCTGPEGLSQTVVFPEQHLTKLRKRVLELQDEIKQQKQRHKVNRTHLFRMNIDLREMESQAEELRAQMRDVLSRKLGKPRRVDRVLDDLLRQMARRHKFSAALGTLPQVMQQLKEWRERHNALEEKYLNALNKYSDDLRKAAALQADVLPQKPMRDPHVMAGTYVPEQYQRDVVRLRIVRSQQLQQIKVLREEIQALKLKPLSPRTPPPSVSPPISDRSEIELAMIKHSAWRPRQKYFPITPVGSQVKIYDVNIMKLLFDCLDHLRVTRDDATELLKDVTAEMDLVLSGQKSRYDAVDETVRKWLLKYGGDPSQYKKHTKAFDAVAALLDRLITDNVETKEAPPEETAKAAESLEIALKDITDYKQPLHEKLGPALAALFHTTKLMYIETLDTMTSLVNSLISEDHTITAEELDQLDIELIVEDIKDCGVFVPKEEVEPIVTLAIECLRSQLISSEEAKKLQTDIEKAMSP